MQSIQNSEGRQLLYVMQPHLQSVLKAAHANLMLGDRTAWLNNMFRESGSEKGYDLSSRTFTQGPNPFKGLTDEQKVTKLAEIVGEERKRYVDGLVTEMKNANLLPAKKDEDAVRQQLHRKIEKQFPEPLARDDDFYVRPSYGEYVTYQLRPRNFSQFLEKLYHGKLKSPEVKAADQAVRKEAERQLLEVRGQLDPYVTQEIARFHTELDKSKLTREWPLPSHDLATVWRQVQRRADDQKYFCEDLKRMSPSAQDKKYFALWGHFLANISQPFALELLQFCNYKKIRQNTALFQYASADSKFSSRDIYQPITLELCNAFIECGGEAPLKELPDPLKIKAPIPRQLPPKTPPTDSIKPVLEPVKPVQPQQPEQKGFLASCKRAFKWILSRPGAIWSWLRSFWKK